MPLEQVLSGISAYDPNADLELVRRAYDFAARAHEGQTRRSGDPYVTHPLAVAQIIAELEPTARGPYCGSLGYIGFDGVMDTSILIRTFTIGRGWVQFPVGGGIVADSDPVREYEETLHKAEGLIKALV